MATIRIVSLSGVPWEAWLRTTGVDLPLLELETAVSAKKDMRDKG